MIEVEPEMKRHLYAALALSGSTLKDWFVKTAVDFCGESTQPTLFSMNETVGSHRATSTGRKAKIPASRQTLSTKRPAFPAEHICSPGGTFGELQSMSGRHSSDEAERTQIMNDDHTFLRLKQPPASVATNSQEKLKIADFFCGVGGISLGLSFAAAKLGLGTDIRLAVDFDEAAAACYAKNFPGAYVLHASVQDLFESRLDAPLTDTEKQLRDTVGPIDILAGGPPCQGHSDLNNFTRRNDPKNLLYLYMARAALVLKPKAILIENVVGSLHDQNSVVQTVIRTLEDEGFKVDCDALNFLTIGVPQRRKRLVITASKHPHSTIAEVQRRFALPLRTLEWSIQDLEDATDQSLMNSPSTPNITTRKRIDYLFENGLYELPNSERPSCHKEKEHSYDTVYGRLRWNLPTQTITSGFYCMCMGRYVHPSRPRTLTAREAARIQFFLIILIFRRRKAVQRSLS